MIDEQSRAGEYLSRAAEMRQLARNARASPSQFADGNERHETVADIERQNVKGARMLAAYWRRQGVEIGPNGDPTKALRAKLGPNGLPRGYRGDDAIPG